MTEFSILCLVALRINVNRVVGDSGAVFNIETFRISESNEAIFKIFALKLVELSCIKGLANNWQNKTSLWPDLKKNFAWLTGIKKLIFGIYNFFGSGHFSIYIFWKKWSKNDRSKIFFSYTNQFFHTFQIHKRTFEIHAYFHIF